MYKLSDAELDILLVLWECAAPISPTELLVKMNENGHSWSISTLQTLLARVLSKEAVVASCKKRFRYYAPACTKEHFLAANTGHLLRQLSTYSPISLPKALVEAELLTAQDLEEAKALLSERT